MVLSGSRRLLVVLSCSHRFSMVLCGSSQCSHRFSVVLLGSRWFSMILSGSRSLLVVLSSRRFLVVLVGFSFLCVNRHSGCAITHITH